MATVQSLTAEKIEQLMSGWEGVELSQEQINSLVSQLWTSQATLDAVMEQFLSTTLPQLLARVSGSEITVDDLNQTVIPDLQDDLDDAMAQVANLQTVTLPGIQQDLINEIEGNAVRPKVYHQPDEPTNPDIDDRDLVLGDTWFDSDDDNAQRMWDGTAWSTMSIDVSEFTFDVRRLISGKHQIY